MWLHLYIDRGIPRVSTKTKSATEKTTVMGENATFQYLWSRQLNIKYVLLDATNPKH